MDGQTEPSHPISSPSGAFGSGELKMTEKHNSVNNLPLIVRVVSVGQYVNFGKSCKIKSTFIGLEETLFFVGQHTGNKFIAVD